MARDSGWYPNWSPERLEQAKKDEEAQRKRAQAYQSERNINAAYRQNWTSTPEQMRAKTEPERQNWLSAMQPEFERAQPGTYRRGMQMPQAGWQPPQSGMVNGAATVPPERVIGAQGVQPQAMIPQPATGLMQPQADIPQATMPQAAQARMQSGMQQEGGNFRTKMRPYRNYQANYDPSTGMPVGLRIGKEGGDFYGEFEFQPGGQNSARLAEMMKQNGGGLKLDATPRNVMPSNPEPSFYDLYMRDPEYRNMSLDQKLALSRGFDAQYRRPDRINSGQASYNDFLDIISGGRKSLPGNAYNERKALKLLQNQQERNFNQQMGIDKSQREGVGLRVDSAYKRGQLNNERDRMDMEFAMSQDGGRRGNRGGKSEGGGLQQFDPFKDYVDENGIPMTDSDLADIWAENRLKKLGLHGMPVNSPEVIAAMNEGRAMYLKDRDDKRKLIKPSGLDFAAQ